MRNLKKILALVLALVMTFSVMATANAFTDDADIDATYEEAIDVLANLGVLKGYEEADGYSIKPQNSITRAEVAAMIYRIATGDVEDEDVALYAGAAKFTDAIPAWAAGYIGYCANAGYIKGYEDGTFRPAGKVTGFEALVMILRVVGYDKMNEFTGAEWATNAASIAKQLEITNNVKPGVLVNAASREVVAEILFKAILVPQVTYTPAFGYANSSIIDDKTSVGMESFGLDCTVGEITAVNYKKGITTLGGETVTNTPADWTDIGYKAYAYTVPGAKKTLVAVSDVVITGESVKVTTDGTDYDYLVDNNKIALNGTKAGVNYYLNGDESTEAAIKDLNKIGVKYDYIDNNADGDIDSVVVTDYTVAEVNGIATDINAGANAAKKDTYYVKNLKTASGATFSGNKIRTGIEVEDLVCVDELEMGDLVTYVEYGGDYYVTVAPSVIGNFTRINYNVVDIDAIDGKSYVIGGETYVKANAWQGNDSDLERADAKAEIELVVYTDAYGYMLMAVENEAVKDYLYAIKNRHTDGILKTTDTVIANVNGSIDEVAVATVDKKRNDYANNDKDLVGKIYSYVADNQTKLTSAGVTFAPTYDENDVLTDYDALNVKKGTASLDGEALRINNKTVVVDLRAYLAGKADAGTVYTGYAEIPAVVEAKGAYIEGANDTISLLFLVGGVNVADYSDEFIVYYTLENYYDGSADNYYLDVVKNGVVVEDYELTDTQYAQIDLLGTGIYTYDYKGNLTFKAFNQVWKNVIWGDGIISVENDPSKVWTDAEDVTFSIITINDDQQTVDTYNHIVGASYVTGDYAEKVNTKAYIVENDSGEAQHIYVILGDYANAAKFAVEPFELNGYNYWVKDEAITIAQKIPADNSFDVTVNYVGGYEKTSTVHIAVAAGQPVPASMNFVLGVKAGYSITDVQVVNAEFDHDVVNSALVLSEIKGDITINVTTAANTYTITDNVTNDWNTTNLPGTADCDEEVTFTATAKEAGAANNGKIVTIADVEGNVIKTGVYANGKDAIAATTFIPQGLADYQAMVNDVVLYTDAECTTKATGYEEGGTYYYGYVSAVPASVTISFEMPASDVVVTIAAPQA